MTVRRVAVVFSALSLAAVFGACRRGGAPPASDRRDAGSSSSAVAQSTSTSSASAAAAASASAQVAALVEKRCGGCHTGDLLAQQRLDAVSWRKVVERMQFWGAPLDPRAGESEKVTAFLVERYGPDASVFSMPIVTTEMLEREDEAALDAGPPVVSDAGGALGLTPR